MFSESALLDLPANIPISPDISEYIQTIIKTERLCSDILNPKARIFRRRSHRAQKKIMQKFFWDNDVYPEDANDVTKLLSLDVIQKGYEEIDSVKIRKGFSLAKYYIGQTKEFDSRYFREILDSARLFFGRLSDDDETHILIKREVTIMIDILLGRIQDFIEPKEELTQSESYFYRVAGDFAKLFLEHDDASKQAYEYYETGILRGNISCYVPFCGLLEESGDIDNALIIAENGWNIFQNRPCLEDYIRLLYKKGDAQSMGTAGIAYQKYMQLFPDDYKPIYKFRYQFNLMDIPTLDSELINIHAVGSRKVFDKDLLDETSAKIMGVLTGNARTLGALAKRQDLLDSVAGNIEYQEILTEQLILLQHGIFDFLDDQFLSVYLGYLKDISEEELGYNFLVNFFEYHSVVHVDAIVAMSAQENGIDIEEEDTFAKELIYHFMFLIYHYAFTDEGLIEELVYIAEKLQVNPEMIDELMDANENMQECRRNLHRLPESLQSQFLNLRTTLLERYGGMFVRKMEHNTFKAFGSVYAGHNDIEARLYTFSLACIAGNHVAREAAMSTVMELGVNPEQAKYVGQLLRDIALYQESIDVLIGGADIDDIEVLDTVCQIGVVQPELVPMIQAYLTQRLDDEGREVVQLEYFLEIFEEDIRLGEKKDELLPKIKRLQAMLCWMEGKSILAHDKEPGGMSTLEVAGGYFKKALNFFDESLEGAVQNLERTPISRETKEEYHAIAKWFGEFAMQHSSNQYQAYGLLLNAFEKRYDVTVLHLLAQITLNLGLRLEAHKWITIMDQENDPDATELWLQYYFSGQTRSEKMRAVYMLLTTEPEALQFVDSGLIDAIHLYAQEQLTELAQEDNKTDESETHLLHLERCYAVGFKVDINRASEYWKKLGRLIREGQIERLNEHFVTYVEPGVYADISPKLSPEKKEAQHLLANLLEETYTFKRVFERNVNYLQLSYIIKDAFHFLQGKLGEDFENDILQQAKLNEQKMVASMGFGYLDDEDMSGGPTIH